MVEVVKYKFKSLAAISIVAFLAWTLSVYDYIMFGNLLPAIGSYYEWSPETLSLLATIVQVGILIVSLLLGPILDRVGRVKGMAISVGMVAASSLLAGVAGFLAASTAFIYLAIVRSISGFGYSEQVVNSTYLNEMYPPKRRGTFYGFVQGGWPIGTLLSSAFILLLFERVTWYEIFWLATIPALVIALVALFFLPESERFKHIAQIKKLMKEGKLKEAEELRKKFDVDISEVKKIEYAQLFSSKLRKHTIFVSLAFLTNWMGIQVLVVLITLVLTASKGVAFTSALEWVIIANAVGYVGYVILGIVGDIIGRRETIMLGWILAGIVGILMLLTPSSQLIVIEALYAIFLFFMIGAYSPLFAYLGESFPTRVRGTGVAFANAMGPIGAFAGSGLLTLLLTIKLHMAMAAIFAGAVPTLISGLLLLGARRVKPGLTLEEIVV